MKFQPNDVQRRSRGAAGLLFLAVVFLMGSFFRAQVLQHGDYVVRAELNIRSHTDRDTRIEFGPYQGDDRRSGYRLVYEAGQKPSLTLLRFSPGRSAVIEMADQDIALADGNSHSVEWRRTINGEMIVLIDNREIIKTIDRAYGDSFDGFAMINKGGEFEVKRVAIFGTQR